MKLETKGIIFDMDNTLLRSAIDFATMKKETFQFLTSHGILANSFHVDSHTSSTLIAEAIETNKMTPELISEMWEIPKKYEIWGMRGADLEPGVTDLLDHLHGEYCMVVITNNSIHAAEKALKENGIFEYFECVVGREMMRSLKPSPDGFLYILEKYVHIPASQWISVGDAWIDGKASAQAGIRFVSYQGNSEKMRERGVIPYAEIIDMKELLDFL